MISKRHQRGGRSAGDSGEQLQRGRGGRTTRDKRGQDPGDKRGWQEVTRRRGQSTRRRGPSTKVQSSESFVLDAKAVAERSGFRDGRGSSHSNTGGASRDSRRRGETTTSSGDNLIQQLRDD